MKLGTLNINASKTRQGDIYSNVHGTWEKIVDVNEKTALDTMVKVCRKRNLAIESKTSFCKTYLKKFFDMTFDAHETSDNDSQIIKHQRNHEQLKAGLKNLIYFFSEFQFEPNFRFVNNFAFACATSEIATKTYVHNYFELIDSGYLNEIDDKMKSIEFEDIMNQFTIAPQNLINKRFRIYYGSQGTGKTTKAMNEANNNVMVCHSAMLPSDLMEDFKFDEGKATFVPSALQIAMVEGKKIVLDEINLLPFESLRFLQSILDGKSQIIYKGKTIKIKDGFEIIGTMNLTVNGSTYALPEPLVDRASELKKYKLSEDDLLSAVL